MFNKKYKKLKRIIENSKLFDSKFYLKTYRDARLASETPLDHFIKVGLQEDRKPNDWFDPVWYKGFYEDIKNSKEIPFIHYIVHGMKEFRFANENEEKEYRTLQNSFDANTYKNTYTDLQKLGDDFDFLWHYVHYGSKENRKLYETTDNMDDYTLLNNSGFFDSSYYLKSYPDIQDANIDPLQHYLQHGFKEGRNPSAKFDTLFYISQNKDIDKINPLVHFLRYGRREGRKPLPEYKSQYTKAVNLFDWFTKDDDQKFSTDKPIDIIIPVYNGYDFLEPLFQSIFKNTLTPYRLLVCNDASPDERVIPLLKNLKEKSPAVDFILLENEKNVGFVGTVNRLVSYVDNHFVLLNTDTEVPYGWLERLMYPVFKMEKVASTTPFTNAGTICSFPNYLEDNPIFENLTVDEIDRYFKKVNFEKTHIDIPTGVGFCMGVNKNLVTKEGMFDTIFGKGYGEENDFCQKAIQKGYKNIHVTNLFVYHKHGGSFASEEKAKLIEKNGKILNQIYPTYPEQVQRTIRENALNPLRDILYFQIKSSRKHTVLIIDHHLGGGANHYTDEAIEHRVSYQQVVCLVYFDFKESQTYKGILKDGKKEFRFEAKDLHSLEQILSLFSIREIFLNSLVSFNVYEAIDTIEILQKKTQASLIIPIHDYFPICPSYTLLDENNRYCNIPENLDRCETCLRNSQGEFKIFEKETNIRHWREKWSKLFDLAEEIRCFSNASKDIFIKAYPKYSAKLTVVPHDISGRFSNIYDPDNLPKQRNIGILGGINIPKGANIVKEMVKYVEKNRLNVKITLIGEISVPIDSEVFYKTGRYDVNELPSLVKELGITEFLIPSVWPETFSYTTDEIMQLGYPLTVFDIGAPAERVQHYERSNIIALDNWENLLKGTNDFR